MKDQDGNPIPTMQQIVKGKVIEIMECQRGEHKTTLSVVSYFPELSNNKEAASFVVTGPTIPLLFITNNDLEAVKKFHTQTHWLMRKEQFDKIKKKEKQQ